MIYFSLTYRYPFVLVASSRNYTSSESQAGAAKTNYILKNLLNRFGISRVYLFQKRKIIIIVIFFVFFSSFEDSLYFIIRYVVLKIYLGDYVMPWEITIYLT